MARDLYAAFDINLLRTLQIIGQERHLGRAAERLFVTQPAVSQALKKLRHHFSDDLFIRTRRGLEPTDYATALIDRVTPVLDQLSLALNAEESFDYSHFDGQVRIALTPHIATFLSARLFDVVKARMPGATLSLTSWNEHSLGGLVSGEIQMGINHELTQVPAEIETQELAEDRFTAYVRDSHPLAANADSILLKDLDGIELAVLNIPGFNTQGSLAERILRANGYRARVGFRSDSPAAITDVLRQSDMLYPTSSYIDARDLNGLRKFNVKLHDQYLNRPLQAYIHRRSRNSPMISWLTGLIKQDLLSR